MNEMCDRYQSEKVDKREQKARIVEIMDHEEM
jgi:hypothetical protein